MIKYSLYKHTFKDVTKQSNNMNGSMLIITLQQASLANIPFTINYFKALMLFNNFAPFSQKHYCIGYYFSGYLCIR